MIDGIAAANWLANYGAVPVGYCLKYVWLAYKQFGASTGMSAGRAYDAWFLSNGKRPGDRNPPAGAAVWWGTRYDGNQDGDVTISLGGGQIAATDWPTGRTGITTLDQREAQIGREYLGWTSSIFDCPINVAAGKDAPASASTLSPEEDDMIFIDAGHVITWPTGYTNSYDPPVFEVLRWVAKGQTSEQWCIDIWVSEAWKAAEFMATFDASKVTIPPVLSADEIAAKVAEALAPKA